MHVCVFVHTCMCMHAVGVRVYCVLRVVYSAHWSYMLYV